MNLESVRLWSQVLATPLVAVLAVWVAWGQYRVQRNRLKLDLFERRLAVYDAVMAYVVAVISNATISMKDLLDLDLGTRQVAFLFPNEVADYVVDVRKKGIRLRFLQQEIERRNRTVREGEETVDGSRIRHEMIEEDASLLTWFGEESPRVSRRFQAYLRLGRD